MAKSLQLFQVAVRKIRDADTPVLLLDNYITEIKLKDGRTVVLNDDNRSIILNDARENLEFLKANGHIDQTKYDKRLSILEKLNIRRVGRVKVSEATASTGF